MRAITLFALVTCSATNIAQEKPMEHVLVSVPIHKKTAETALPVTVLSGEELRRSASTTIGDTLGNAPGLANASFGPGVGQPVIRGHQGPRVSVLQNGVSNADASGNSADHAVSAEPLLAESIEVLRGPATLLYGGGAIGGVVNIIDNRIPIAPQSELGGGLEYRHDTASELNGTSALFEGGDGAFAFHFSGLIRERNDLEIPAYAINDVNAEENTRGFIANTDGETSSYSIGASSHFEKGFWGLSVNQLNNEYGIPPGSHENHAENVEEGHFEEEEVRLDMEQSRYDSILHLHQPAVGIEIFRGFLTYTDYQHVEVEADGNIGTEFNNKSWESRAEIVHAPLAGFHGVLGLQWRDNVFSALGEEAFIPKTDNREIGIFLLEDYHSGNWAFEFGARYDYAKRKPEAQHSRDFANFSFSGSAVWDISEQWTIGASISASERAPVTEELYSNTAAGFEAKLVTHAATGAIEIGNPGLDQETARNLDLSVIWQADATRVSFTVFYNDFKDYIALANSGQVAAEIAVLNYLQDDAEFYGGELDARLVLATFSSGVLELDIGADAVRGELDQLGDVPRLPPYRVSAGLNWTSDNFLLYARRLYAAEQNNPGANEANTASYTRWDAGADYHIDLSNKKTLAVFINFKNISDEDIRLSTSFLRDNAPEAGQSIEAGVRFRF